MNTVALIIVSLINGTSFTIVDSMEECRAIQQLGKAEAVEQGALSITDFGGVLTIVNDKYETVMVTCAEQNQTPKKLYDKYKARQ